METTRTSTATDSYDSIKLLPQKAAVDSKTELMEDNSICTTWCETASYVVKLSLPGLGKQRRKTSYEVLLLIFELPQELSEGLTLSVDVLGTFYIQQLVFVLLLHILFCRWTNQAANTNGQHSHFQFFLSQGLVWFGLEGVLKNIQLPQAATPSTRPGFFKSHST